MQGPAHAPVPDYGTRGDLPSAPSMYGEHGQGLLHATGFPTALPSHGQQTAAYSQPLGQGADALRQASMPMRSVPEHSQLLGEESHGQYEHNSSQPDQGFWHEVRRKGAPYQGQRHASERAGAAPRPRSEARGGANVFPAADAGGPMERTAMDHEATSPPSAEREAAKAAERENMVEGLAEAAAEKEREAAKEREDHYKEMEAMRAERAEAKKGRLLRLSNRENKTYFTSEAIHASLGSEAAAVLESEPETRIINPQEGARAGPYLIFIDEELAMHLLDEGSTDLFDPLDETIDPTTFMVSEVDSQGREVSREATERVIAKRMERRNASNSDDKERTERYFFSATPEMLEVLHLPISLHHVTHQIYKRICQHLGRLERSNMTQLKNKGGKLIAAWCVFVVRPASLTVEEWAQQVSWKELKHLVYNFSRTPVKVRTTPSLLASAGNLRACCFRIPSRCEATDEGRGCGLYSQVMRGIRLPSSVVTPSFRSERQARQASVAHQQAGVAAQLAQAPRRAGPCPKFWKEGSCLRSSAKCHRTHGTPEDAALIACARTREGRACTVQPPLICPYRHTLDPAEVAMDDGTDRPKPGEQVAALGLGQGLTTQPPAEGAPTPASAAPPAPAMEPATEPDATPALAATNVPPGQDKQSAATALTPTAATPAANPTFAEVAASSGSAKTAADKAKAAEKATAANNDKTRPGEHHTPVGRGLSEHAPLNQPYHVHAPSMLTHSRQAHARSKLKKPAIAPPPSGN